MALLTSSLTLDLAVAVTLIVYLVYKYWTRNFDYWQKRNVPHIKPKFPFGTVNLGLFTKRDSHGREDQKIYEKFPNEKYVGIYVFSEPRLMIRDPEVIKYIMTKDFNHFVNRKMFPLISEKDYISHHLFNMEGDEWKRMRTKLSPTFTSGKMKNMFALIEVVAKQLKDYLDPLAEKNSTIELKDVIERFNIDIIATCAFGLEVNSLTNPDSEFRRMGLKVFETSVTIFLKQFSLMFIPGLIRFLNFTQIDIRVSEFITKVLKDTLQYRKKHNVVRNDFIDLLTKVNEKTLTVDKEDIINGETTNLGFQTSPDNDEMTLKEMAAQMFAFFAAALETSASAVTFCLYEVSKNKEFQLKIRKEIDTVLQRHGDKVTYQSLQEMPYIDKCINETLRRYAALSFLTRQCTKNYQVPGTDLVIEEGMKIVIPVYSIHHNSEHYPDPYKFDPERFSEEEIHSRHNYTHLPFGEGPRICIGKRLGQMQVKMAIITILRNYELTTAPGLPDTLPLDSYSLLTKSSVPVELVISKRKN